MDRPDHGDNLAGYQRILFEDTTHGQARQAGRDSRVLLIHPLSAHCREVEHAP